MLARLDRVEGVKESRVDWTGRYFLVALQSDADGARIGKEAALVLGETSRRIEGEAASVEIDAYRRGEPWMRAGETLRLSREEARILGERRARQAAGAAALDAGQSRRLAALLEDEMAAAFERLHASGGAPDRRFAAEWSVVVARVGARSRGFLTEGQTARVVKSLEAPF